MRVNLSVPFDEKEQAKNLGARWDAACRTWYIKDAERLEPFLRWITPTRLLMSIEGRVQANKGRPRKPRIDSKPGVATLRTDHSLPDCGCTHVAAWSDCAHTFSPGI